MTSARVGNEVAHFVRTVGRQAAISQLLALGNRHALQTRLHFRQHAHRYGEVLQPQTDQHRQQSRVAGDLAADRKRFACRASPVRERLENTKDDGMFGAIEMRHACVGTIYSKMAPYQVLGNAGRPLPLEGGLWGDGR